MTTEIEQHIAAQATESAAAYPGLHYAAYSIGDHRGDVAALAARLGREPTIEEQSDLQRSIRDRLCAAMGGSPTPLVDRATMRQQDLAARYLDGDERALGGGPRTAET